MAFVIPTAETKPSKKVIVQPGPGDYKIQQKHIIQQSSAPFNSTTQRKPKKVKTEGDVVPPGPGSYNTNMYYEKNTGQSAFKSKSTRFVPQYNSQIGPGSYNPYPEIKKQKPPPKPKQNNIFNMLFKQNQSRKSQSIKQPPHYVRVVFKDPQNKNIYTSQYVDTNFISNKEIGPGQYDVDSIQKKTNGVSWQKSKAKRFQESRQQSVGPGSYNVDTNNTRGSVSASAVFRSQDTRSYFDRMRFKSSHQPYIDIMNKLDIKSTCPGPGDYDVETSFKQKQSFVQCFGSQSIRFQDNLKQNTSAGPGSYNFNTKVQKPMPLVCRLAKRKRCKSEITNRQPQIRPHSYEASNNTLHDNLYKKFKNGYFGNFGSKASRFYDSNNSNPGPGKYSLLRKQKQVSTTSYFANSKRSQRKCSDSPFLSYNTNMYDISRSLERKQDFLKNLELVDVKKPGFQSSTVRFQQPRKQITQQQSYQCNKLQNTQCADIKPKKISAVFKSTTKRSSLQAWDSSTPPPGYYYRQLKMQKVSYNMKYGFIQKVKKERQR